MAWYMPDFLFGNSKEPLLKVMESVLSSIFTPVVDFFKTSFNSLYSNYPNLSMVGTGLVGLLGYITFNKFRTKKQAERVSKKEENLDKIPAMKRKLDESSESQSEGFRQQASAMLNVTAAASANSNVVLGLSNKLRELGEQLSSLLGASDRHTRTLDTISRGTESANTKLDGFRGYKGQLDTIEGLQRTGNTNLDAIAVVVKETNTAVRARSNTH